MKKTIGGQDIEVIDETTWRTVIDTPIFGTTVALNDALIRQAIKHSVTLIVCVKIDSEQKLVCERLSPRKWKHEAQLIRKVFKFENNPMLMWQREIKENT
jgi:hypothetical protein